MQARTMDTETAFFGGLEITANPMEAIAAKTPSWMICDSSIFIVGLLLIIAM
jgi:uncharacterized membrane-anchored protein